jgi:hypothetical protein
MDWAKEAKEGYERLGAKAEIAAVDNLMREIREQKRG